MFFFFFSVFYPKIETGGASCLFSAH